MSTTANNADSDTQDRHPIDSEIVDKVATEFDIRADILHDVLVAMEEIWGPYRDSLDTVLAAFHEGNQYRIWVEGGIEYDVIVVGGMGLRPEHLIQRIDLQAMLEPWEVTPVEVGLAVNRAHNREAERRSLSMDYPVVIQKTNRTSH